MIGNTCRHTHDRGGRLHRTVLRTSTKPVGFRGSFRYSLQGMPPKLSARAGVSISFFFPAMRTRWLPGDLRISPVHYAACGLYNSPVVTPREVPRNSDIGSNNAFDFTHCRSREITVSTCNQYGNTIDEITYVGFWHQAFKIWCACCGRSSSRYPAGPGRRARPGRGEIALGRRPSERVASSQLGGKSLRILRRMFHLIN